MHLKLTLHLKTTLLSETPKALLWGRTQFFSAGHYSEVHNTKSANLRLEEKKKRTQKELVACGEQNKQRKEKKKKEKDVDRKG